MAKKSKKSTTDSKPIVVETHRDLRANIRAICERVNSDPELARLILVNPILAFEDAGVEMSAQVKQHIRKTLGRPRRLEKRKESLAKELETELGELGIESIPKEPAARAALLFDSLGLEPMKTSHRKQLSLRELEGYADRHPLVAKLARYDRACRGGLILHTRGSYNKFKAGERRHRWVKAVRFKI